MWRSTGVWIAFRGGQDCERVFAFAGSMQSAIPKADVAFPTFEVALCRHNDGKLLARLTLQRRHRERACRCGNHAAERNDRRAALDFVDHTTAFRALNESLEGALEHRFCLSRDGHFLFLDT